MNHLPTALHLEILAFVPLGDRLEYTRVNSFLAKELNPEVRSLEIKDENLIKEFLTSDSFRSSILKRINHPFKQLNLNLAGFTDDIPNLNEFTWQISLQTLKIRWTDLKHLLPRIDQVQQLKLELEFLRNGNNGTNNTQILLYESAELIYKLSRLNWLRDLSVSSSVINQIPALPKLQKLEALSCPLLNLSSLNIPKLTNLRCLKLVRCQGITDVTTLGHIHELHLIECLWVTNISALNHNHTISVRYCPIQNYSKSFEFCKVIDIAVTTAITKSINMEHLKAVRSLSINYHLLPPNISAPCFHYLPLTLRSLSIESVKSFSLPDEHQLKEIIIKNCKDILLENMENIPFVYIYHCSSIRDWIPLQNNENVMIYSDVEYDLDLKQLYNIKNLKIELNYLSRYINLSYITHLILKDSPNYFHFDVEKVLMNAKQLKELEFEIETETYTVHGCKFVNFLEHLEVLERVIIHNVMRGTDNFYSFYEKMKISLGHAFLVDISSLGKKIILTRIRNNDNTIDKKRRRKSKCILL